MQDLIDTFAYEYNWSKEEIFELYPDEIPILYKKIIKRHKIDMQIKERERILNWQMLLQIQHASKPSEIHNTLMANLNKIDLDINGEENIKTNTKPYYEVKDMDRDKLSALKNRINTFSRK